jgi:diguanylate cyclase (GGDEF)-like protein
MVIKPDKFKDINDNYGHEAGDKVLKKIAYRIKNHLGEKGIAVRFKSDEFIAILPNTGKEKALIKAEELKEKLYNIRLLDRKRKDYLNVPVSIGIAEYPTHSTNHKGLTEKAYEQMWEARNSGGNRIQSL